jgi:DNA-binding GntR family transcriptional regulator
LVSQISHVWDTKPGWILQYRIGIPPAMLCQQRTPAMSQMLLIHDQLREMILSLDIGPGERLTERWLEARFQGSRTPVRAALVRLEAEGLVQRDGRNWMVAPIDLGEIEALAEFRAPREEWHKVGTDFHVEIARLAGNPFLVKAIEGVMTRLARPRWLEVWTEASRAQAWAEHRRILACIRDQQPDEAAREAAEHVRDTRDRLLRSLNDDRRGLRARGVMLVARHPALR